MSKTKQPMDSITSKPTLLSFLQLLVITYKTQIEQSKHEQIEQLMDGITSKPISEKNHGNRKHKKKDSPF